jgi:integrative and conjugative element protein (TIGR02256 family)
MRRFDARWQSASLRERCGIFDSATLDEWPVVTTNFDRALEAMFREAGDPFWYEIWGGQPRLSDRTISADAHVLVKVGQATLRIKAHVQRHDRSTEAGGILLGRLLTEDGGVIVDQVTVPGPQDRKSRFRFFRAERPAQKTVDEAWTRSGGEINYLGEWHTHAEDDPTPSPHDRTDWRRLLATQRYEQDALFFVIAGRRMLRVWELARGQAAALPLSLGDGPGDEAQLTD